MPEQNKSAFLTWVARIPTALWGPVVAGVLMLIMGLIGFASGRPLLLPSLGPSAFEHSEQPKDNASRFYNTFMGHMIALGAGFLAVALVNAWEAPPVLSVHTLTLARVGAAILAVAFTLAATTLARAFHPPAAATTLLVALGAFRTGGDALIVFLGVLVLAALGEIARQTRIRALQPPNPSTG
jgi:hypothetical protein